RAGVSGESSASYDARDVSLNSLTRAPQLGQPSTFPLYRLGTWLWAFAWLWDPAFGGDGWRRGLRDGRHSALRSGAGSRSVGRGCFGGGGRQRQLKRGRGGRFGGCRGGGGRRCGRGVDR